MTTVLLILGLCLLTTGAELLVRGASRLAKAVGISPLVVGLTVVALGTSSPELFVCVLSALQGQPDIALGNVVGSNIFNVLFILGLCAVITPLTVNQQLVRLDVPLMIAVSVILLFLSLDAEIGRVEGLVLFLGLIGYTIFAIRLSRKESREVFDEHSQELGAENAVSPQSMKRDVFFVIGGLALLTLGAKFLVDGAIEIARAFGMSELVIGLTIVAAGTSLPEVATSVVAAIRKERDIAVGNIVGSNIYNILCIVGLSSLLSPVSVSPAALTFDIPVMIGVAGLCLPIFFSGLTIERWEGALFLFYYAAYTAYLILQAGEHSLLPVYSSIMLLFVLPASVVTLFVLSKRQWTQK